jgi:hypothetical protein
MLFILITKNKKEYNMKAYLLFFALIAICLAPVCRAQSGNTNLEGTWSINKVEIRQIIDGVATLKTYTPEDVEQSFVPRPRQISFTTNTATFEYADYQRAGTYHTEGNTLFVTFAGGIDQYSYSLDGSNLQLDYSTHYTINNDQESLQAEEQCRFYGQR